MSGNCYVVPPRSRKVIREIAKSVREMIRWTEPCFPIVEFMEAYHQIDPEFVYDVRVVRRWMIIMASPIRMKN